MVWPTPLMRPAFASKLNSKLRICSDCDVKASRLPSGETAAPASGPGPAVIRSIAGSPERHSDQCSSSKCFVRHGRSDRSRRRYRKAPMRNWNFQLKILAASIRSNPAELLPNRWTDLQPLLGAFVEWNFPRIRQARAIDGDFLRPCSPNGKLLTVRLPDCNFGGDVVL